MSAAPEYDVVIVGGRPGGASLAARLGARGRRVLVVDRAQFPSAPSVPSCPIIYPSTMRLLDEIGLDERDYAGVSGKIRRFVLFFDTYFDARFTMPEVFGRDYVYGVDRARFDAALWAHLGRYPSVTARAGFSVTDLVRDADGRVVGVEGKSGGGPTERFLARCVVGADGRFSLVARLAGAKVREDFSDRTSTVYFADWEGVEGADGTCEALTQVYTTGRGAAVLYFPKPDGVVTIVTHLRADRVKVDGDAESFYLSVLNRYDRVRRWLRSARRIGPLFGMKRIGNRYVDAGGPGWVLVGDAFHQKDPVDGQGMYDAMIEAKVLDEALAPFLAGERSFDEALAVYRRRAYEETHAMFLATMQRLKRELYEDPPEIVIRTLLRWQLNDPEYQRRFMLFLSRGIPPERLLPRTLLPAAAVRGTVRDLRRALRIERG